MFEIADLIREYGELMNQQRILDQRKEELRARIMQLLQASSLRSSATPYGIAQRRPNFRLTPRREPVLALLSSEDLFPFARFTPTRVKELLVPKYGRETLIPLFDIQKTETLFVKTSLKGRA